MEKTIQYVLPASTLTGGVRVKRVNSPRPIWGLAVAVAPGDTSSVPGLPEASLQSESSTGCVCSARVPIKTSIAVTVASSSTLNDWATPYSPRRSRLYRSTYSSCVSRPTQWVAARCFQMSPAPGFSARTSSALAQAVSATANRSVVSKTVRVRLPMVCSPYISRLYPALWRWMCSMYETPISA